MQPNQSIFWEIRHPNQKKPSFIFGTMHVNDSRVFHTVDAVLPYIQRADRYAAEIALEQEHSSMPMSVFLFKDGKTLSDFIGNKKYEKLHRVLQKAFDLNLHRYQRFLPFFTINFITNNILTSDKSSTLDEYLWKLAQDHYKPCIGVETRREQMKIIQNIPETLQVQMLLSIGKNVSNFRKQTLHLTNQYLEGNIQAVYIQSKKSAGKLRKILLYQRNERMSNRIATYCATESVFVAIGAAHLAGQKGVLNLLKQKQFVVKPINLDYRITKS